MTIGEDVVSIAERAAAGDAMAIDEVGRARLRRFESETAAFAALTDPVERDLARDRLLCDLHYGRVPDRAKSDALLLLERGGVLSAADAKRDLAARARRDAQDAVALAGSRQGTTFIDLAGIEEPPPYEGLWGGRLVEGYPTILYGEGSQGKSLLAASISLAAVSGVPFLGHQLPHGNVLFVDFELSDQRQRGRLADVARGFGLAEFPVGIKYLSGERKLTDLCADIKSICESQEIVLLIIDSLGAGAGVDPDSAQDVIPVMTSIRDLRVTSILVDHQSKRQDKQTYAAKTPFGSVYKFNLARSVLQIQKTSGERGRMDLQLNHVKYNFGELAEPLGIRATFQKGRITFDEIRTGLDSQQDLQQRVWGALNYPMSTNEIAASLQIPRHTAANALTLLRGNGRVTRTGSERRPGKWTRIVSDDESGGAQEEAPF